MELNEERTITKFLWMPKVINWKIKWLVTATWIERHMKVVEQLGWVEFIEYKDWVAVKWS